VILVVVACISVHSRLTLQPSGGRESESGSGQSDSESSSEPASESDLEAERRPRARHTMIPALGAADHRLARARRPGPGRPGPPAEWPGVSEPQGQGRVTKGGPAA
jgi:hypothetical protein